MTLADARRHILDLPAETQQIEAWQTAAEVLLLGMEMVARIGMMRALYPTTEPAGTPKPRRKRAKAYEIIT